MANLIFVLLLMVPMFDEDKAAMEIHPIVKGELKEKIKAKGVFLPAKGTEIPYLPKVYKGKCEILEVAAPGTMVAKGDTLCRINTEFADDQIVTARLDVKSAELRYKEALAKRRITKLEMDLERLRAEKDLENAELALKGYQSFLKPMDKEQQELTRQSYQHNIDDQEDEILQLNEMYKEDELTEATEELVLKRSKRNLDRSKRGFELQKMRHKYFDVFTEPPRLLSYQRVVRNAKLALQRLVIRGDYKLEVADIEADRAKHALEVKLKNLDRLLCDRDKMEIKAPHDGLLLHGDSKLKGSVIIAGGNAPVTSSLFTLAAPGFVKVSFAVPEKEIWSLTEKMEARIKPTALPKETMMGEVIKINRFPTSGFLCEAKVHGQWEKILPGMTCELVLKKVLRKETLLCPSNALKAENGEAYCWVLMNGEIEKRRVKIGLSNQIQTEILEGLSEGDRILIKK